MDAWAGTGSSKTWNGSLWARYDSILQSNKRWMSTAGSLGNPVEAWPCLPHVQELGEVNEEKGADPAPGICMRAVDTPETRSVWPYSFQVEYQVCWLAVAKFH